MSHEGGRILILGSPSARYVGCTSRRNGLRCTSKAKSGGTLAQVVVPIAKPTPHAASDLQFAVIPFDFVDASHFSGGHPEAPDIKWLKRGSLTLVPVGQVKRRVRIIKLHGNAGRPDNTAEHFLLNIFMFPLFRGPVERAIYLSCPFECGGRLKMPGSIGSAVKCSVCQEETRWY